MLGTYALSSGYYDAYYEKAQKVRTMIKREHDAVFENFDLIVSPTSPTVAFELGAKTADPLAMYLNDLLTIPSCMAGLPGLSIPCGLTEGLPVGLQLIGPQFDENMLFKVGHALERVARLRRRAGAAALMAWEAVIGLEIHVQLKTRSKMFCRCANGFGGEPNTQTCPVCLGVPRRAAGRQPARDRGVHQARARARLRRSRERAVFHRKNYFYPDLPKAYQISQYDEPLCSDGKLAVPTADGDVTIGIVRAHLEEDAAKNVHVAASGRIHGATATLVDFNRGGTPLVEIVTAPDIHDAETAKRFLQLLRQTVVELDLSDAELEKGSMRFDVNVSVRPAGSDELRTRTELKNMNSFNFAAKGIEREIARQIEIYESGGEVAAGDAAFRCPGDEESPPMRSKEEAQDYRYFPEPDLVPVHPPAELVERAARRDRRAARRAHPPDRRHALVLRRRRARHRRARPALVRRGRRRAPTRRRLRTCSRTSSSRRASSPAPSMPASWRSSWPARSEIPRAVFDEALAKVGDDGFSAEPYLEQKAVVGRRRSSTR